MPPKSSKQDAPKKPLAIRALIALMALGVVYFAVQGGEYGSTDLVRQRARMATLQREVDSLRTQVDSLNRYRKAIETDPIVQERLAREEFGMVKGNREILYRFAN